MRISNRFTRFFLFLLISGALSYTYLFLPAIYQNLDDKLRDFLFIARGVQSTNDSIIIVDIDEKSLNEIGQWPWERNIVSKMLQNLSNAGAGIIGLDIVFSEEDKTSPHRFAQRYQIGKKLPNYDLELAQAVQDTPTILGYVFNFNQNYNADKPITPSIPAIFIEKNLPEMNYLLEPIGILSNIESIQSNSYSSGFINNVPDASGSIRSVPLVMRYEDTIYPSLAFEMFRIANNAQKVIIDYSPTGISTIYAGDIKIPTDRNGRMYLNHRGPAKTFHYISASDIVNNNFDYKTIEGKFVLVGTSAYGLMDLRSNPFDNIVPGIEIHATLIDNLVNHDMLLRPDWIELFELGMIVFLSAVVILGFSLLPPISFFLGSLTLFGAVGYLNYYLLFEHHIIVNILFMILTLFFSIVSVLSMNYFLENRQKEQVKKKFAQKVSPQVMEDLLKKEGFDALQIREVEVTVFFSDIRSFTTISEQLGSPQKLVEFLNYYMTEMADSIVSREGTIDKFIGDAIMAYWNAPNHVVNHADMAVKAALEQIAKRAYLNSIIEPKYGFELDYGIGINTGIVTVGDIGSKGRSDYTVIGDAVNLASRVEGLCKYYGVRLIISEFTKEKLKESYVIRELDWVRVKGKLEPVKIFEVISQNELNDSVADELKQYNDALGLFQNGEYLEAYEKFVELEQLNMHKLYILYQQRCRYLIDNGIDHFDGVFDFDFK